MKNVLLFCVAIILGAAFMFGIETYAVKTKPKLDIKYENASSFSLDSAPSNSLTGKIVKLSGDVSLQSRTSTEAAKISSRREIKQGESLYTASGSATIQFENNAIITLNPNSGIGIVQTLPLNFVFGHYKGTVEYSRNGETPLSVRAMHLLISQDADSMLVNLNLEEESVTIDVKDGKITVAFNDLDYNSNVLEITEGKKLIFNDSTREAEIN